MNGLNIVRATERASTGLIGRKAKIVVTSREHVVNLILQVSANVGKCSDGPLDVRHRVGTAVGRPAVRSSPRVQGTVKHLARIPEVVAEQRVDDSLTSIGPVNFDVHVCDHERESWKVGRWSSSPVPEWPSQLICCVDHGLSACSRVGVGDVASHLEELLFEVGQVNTVPRREVHLIEDYQKDCDGSCGVYMAYGIVSAVPISASTVSTLSYTIVISARNTVNRRDAKV